MTLLNRYRFGVFQCDDFSAVHDPAIEYCLPPAASNITVEKKAVGFTPDLWPLTTSD
jgi:hypothetical protein